MQCEKLGQEAGLNLISKLWLQRFGEGYLIAFFNKFFLRILCCIYDGDANSHIYTS